MEAAIQLKLVYEEEAALGPFIGLDALQLS